MPLAALDDVQLYYEISGPNDGEPLLLIHGLGAQMIAWYPGFVARLEQTGFSIIRFDNRDVGLSTRLPHGPPYTLEDMAGDAAGLLAHIGLTSAHIVGQSMGGMVAQQLAISFPAMVRSLTIFYSAPGPGYQTNDEEVWRTRAAIPATEREDQIRQYIAQERTSGLEGFDDEWIQQFAAAVIDRGHSPDGAERQMQAIANSPDLLPSLARVAVPTAVLHGRDDRLLRYHGSFAIAEAIPHAELHLYAGMGHQLVPRLWDEFVAIIHRTAERVTPV